MSIQPIYAPRLHERIAEEIAHLIAAGTFKVGSKLPSERLLAQSLKVSRSSLREALSSLELEGVIQIRLGSGAYVRRRPKVTDAGQAEMWRHGTILPGSEGELSPFDVMRTRRIVEPEAAALAARHATAGQRSELAQAFERLKAEMRTNQTQTPADRDFHVLIARASGNAALALVIENLWQQSQGPLGQRMQVLYVTRGRKQDNIREHRNILEAIVTGNSARARQEMRRHLLSAERQRLQEIGGLNGT
ncbi:MAG: FadR/GntR family transcriptional regulator [Hylemonella sp.]